MSRTKILRHLTIAVVVAFSLCMQAQAATVACTPTAGFTRCQRITYSGGFQNFTVPSNISKLDIRVWGAAGGGANLGVWTQQAGGAGGGFSKGTVAVTPGQNLTLVVGQGGIVNSTAGTFGGGGAGGASATANRIGSSGGGASGVYNITTLNTLLVAGGGGGSSTAANLAGRFTGGGGGLIGGQDTFPTESGRGGTQLAGGAAATPAGTLPCATLPTAGVQLFSGGSGGGDAGTANAEGGGGGGGGWYGGGGGNCQKPGGTQQNGAGGGGSGYIAGPGVSAATTVAGANFNVSGACSGIAASGGNTDPLYSAGIGQGSCGGTGGNGEITIQWADPSITITKVSNAPGTFTFTGTNGWTSQDITTVTSGVGVTGAKQVLTAGTATTITESAPPAGFILTDITCTGLGAGGTATPNLAARTVSFDTLAMAEGSNIACTYTNTFTADVSVTKTNTPGVNGEVDQASDTVSSGATTTYTLTVRNNGPAAANASILRDPSVAGLNCTTAPTCAASGGAVCPTTPTVAQLQAGVAIPTLPLNGSVVFTLTCTVTATGF